MEVTKILDIIQNEINNTKKINPTMAMGMLKIKALIMGASKEKEKE